MKKIDAGIYVHVPFCKKKCLYCDFYSLRADSELENYSRLLIDEAKLYESQIANYHFSTLYLGGGTPSLLDEKNLDSLFEYFQSQGYWSGLKEITLEANPESLTLKKLRFYRSLGINRISLGVQSFQPDIQKKLGRLAGAREVLGAIESIQSVFENYSVDLIYGIPGQKLGREIRELLRLSPPHISAYCLTLAEGTPLYSKKNDFTLGDEELNRQFLELHEALESSGYTHYEISNYAKKGRESRHNLHYWRRHFYLGLGAGASGFLNGLRYSNDSLEGYREKLNQKKFPRFDEERLSDEEVLIENYMLGLRTVEGADFLYESSDTKFCIENFINQGLLVHKEDKVLPTPRAWTLLDGIIREIYATF